jgi:hypothetical protein
MWARITIWGAYARKAQGVGPGVALQARSVELSVRTIVRFGICGCGLRAQRRGLIISYCRPAERSKGLHHRGVIGGVGGRVDGFGTRNDGLGTNGVLSQRPAQLV